MIVYMNLLFTIRKERKFSKYCKIKNQKGLHSRNVTCIRPDTDPARTHHASQQLCNAIRRWPPDGKTELWKTNKSLTSFVLSIAAISSSNFSPVFNFLSPTGLGRHTTGQEPGCSAVLASPVSS